MRPGARCASPAAVRVPREIMDLYRIIGELVAERNRLQRIIDSLEAVGAASGQSVGVRGPKRGRKSMDTAGRKEVSARMKSYWAKRREAQNKDAAAGAGSGGETTG